MKKYIIALCGLSLLGCSTLKNNASNHNNISGEYYLQSDKLYQALSDDNYSKMVINEDGTYELYKAEIQFTPVIEQCNYASKGKWKTLTDDVIEITSEDNFTKQKGFEYEIQKENKFSQDSLYFNVEFPADFHPVNLNFGFNHINNKSVKTNKTYIVLPKAEYVRVGEYVNNLIQLRLEVNNIEGVNLYKSRVSFKIFEENFDTEKYNYFTIRLPYFDRCFFEFEPYKKDLILIKNKNTLIWKGVTWKRKINNE